MKNYLILDTCLWPVSHTHTHTLRRDTLSHTNISCGERHYDLTDSRPSILINSALVPSCLHTGQLFMHWSACFDDVRARRPTSAGSGPYRIATSERCTPTFARLTLSAPSVRIYSFDCHNCKSHHSPEPLHHDNTLQHAPLHPIRPAKAKNTAHPGSGQKKGILRLRTQPALCEERCEGPSVSQSPTERGVVCRSALRSAPWTFKATRRDLEVITTCACKC